MKINLFLFLYFFISWGIIGGKMRWFSFSKEANDEQYSSRFSTIAHPTYPIIQTPSPPPLQGEVKIGYMIFEPIPTSRIPSCLENCCFLSFPTDPQKNGYQYAVYQLTF
jgi:hypothetical protein